VFDCSANLWQNIDEAKEKCGFEQMSSTLKLDTAFKAEIVRSVRIAIQSLRLRKEGTASLSVPVAEQR
jgi:hypothetical protein